MLMRYLTLQQILKGILNFGCDFLFSVRGDCMFLGPRILRKGDIELYLSCTIYVFEGSCRLGVWLG